MDHEDTRVSMRMTSALALIALGITTAGAQPSDTVRLDVQRGSRLWIEGTSNVHDWSCKATTFDARIDIDSSYALRGESQLVAEIVRRVSVKVAVRDLKCGNRKMDHDLYNALKASDPSVPSNILGIFNAAAGAATRGTNLETEGTVAVAGVENKVRVRITMEHLGDGTVKARGSVPILMTDFGVTPPTGLFGLIKSRNEVVVKFDLVIASPTRVAVR